MAAKDFLDERGAANAHERGMGNASSAFDQCDEGYQKLYVDFVQNGMYSRTIFPQPMRELLAVATLTALYRPEELTLHLRYAVRLNPVELVREAIIQAGVYGGFPSVARGLSLLTAVLAEEDTVLAEGI